MTKLCQTKQLLAGVMLACTMLIVSSLVRAQIPRGVEAGRPSAATPLPLTPEVLGMPRTQIALPDHMIRIFNGRGGVGVRDKSVTGLQFLKFPPFDLRYYHFSLGFQEKGANVFIQDLTPDYYEAKLRDWKNPHPLGMNFITGLPYALLVQQAYWQPNAYFRTGTFHKLFGKRWVSFGITTKASVSADRDEVYMKVEIENRDAEPLSFVVSPNQRSPELALNDPNVKMPLASAVTHPDAFTLASDQIRITVVSDLPVQGKEGWRWEIPGKAKRTAYFAIIPQKASEPAPAVEAHNVAERMEQADQAVRRRLAWAEEALPQVSTGDPAFDDLYRRSILSVLECRWERENFMSKPFYTVGTWTFTIPWDISYASEMLSVLDPAGLRQALVNFIHAGLMTNNWVPWNGKASGTFPGTNLPYWYVQSPFAELRVVQDYLNQTGDTAFLDRTEEGATILEWMKRMGRDLEKKYGRPDRLLDFGSGSQTMLEIRTDGYEHVVAAWNGMAAGYFRQLAEWCRQRNDPEAAQFETWSNSLKNGLDRKLWDEKHNWFVNLYPDGSPQLVWSYHLFDLLDSGVLSTRQQDGLVSHLKEGEFLGPLGMYSMSKADLIHFDYEDADWGGGGQYTGEPLRVAESLYRLGYPETAWNILQRCTLWTKYFPLITQEVFTDTPRIPEAEMPLELDAGSSMGAIVFGVFGVHPQEDGTLRVAPSYHQELGEARMNHYRFRGHSYDVVLGPGDYEVFRDGKLATHLSYTQTVEFTPAGEVRK